MRNQLRQFLFLITVLVSNASAEPNRCDEFPKKAEATFYRQKVCQCGKVLSNLGATLPKGMQIEAVCDLNINGRPVVLKDEKISLDQYLPTGNYYEGKIYLSGDIVVSGKVIENPAEDSSWVFFYPKPSMTSRRTVFSDYFAELSVDGEIFKVPHITSTNTGECWQADATFSLSGIVVSLYDVGHGAGPIGVKVLSLSEYKKCNLQ